MSEGRTCNRCNQHKAFEHFRPNDKGGYRGQCKQCLSELQQEYKRRKREAEPEKPVDPWEWIRELARLKQQQPHSFF